MDLRNNANEHSLWQWNYKAICMPRQMPSSCGASDAAVLCLVRSRQHCTACDEFVQLLQLVHVFVFVCLCVRVCICLCVFVRLCASVLA